MPAWSARVSGLRPSFLPLWNDFRHRRCHPPGRTIQPAHFLRERRAAPRQVGNAHQVDGARWIDEGQHGRDRPAGYGGPRVSDEAAREGFAERERQTKARALSVQVHKLFNPLEEEVSCKKVDADGMLLDIAHLIDTKSIEKYQNRYSTAAKQLKNCQMVVTGPWPPYHFLPERCGRWLATARSVFH